MGAGIHVLRVNNRLNHLADVYEVINVRRKYFQVFEHSSFKDSDSIPGWASHRSCHPFTLQTSNNRNQASKITHEV